MTTQTTLEHRWYDGTRWFYGFGPSMSPHRCDGTTRCEWRVVTVTTEYGEWTTERPTVCQWCGNPPCDGVERVEPHHSLCCLDGPWRACWRRPEEAA